MCDDTHCFCGVSVYMRTCVQTCACVRLCKVLCVCVHVLLASIAVCVCVLDLATLSACCQDAIKSLSKMCPILR